MGGSKRLDSDTYDEHLYAEFWGRGDLWTRVKAPIATGIMLAGALSGIAWIARSLA